MDSFQAPSASASSHQTRTISLFLTYKIHFFFVSLVGLIYFEIHHVKLAGDDRQCWLNYSPSSTGICTVTFIAGSRTKPLSTPCWLQGTWPQQRPRNWLLADDRRRSVSCTLSLVLMGWDDARGYCCIPWEGLSKSTEHLAPKPKFEWCKSETSHRWTNMLYA